MASKLNSKTTKKTSQGKPMIITKNKVITYRFAATANLEFLTEELEKRYLGLDRAEIVKLALTELYEKIKYESPSNLDIDKIMQAIESNSNGFDMNEEEFFNWWNKNKRNLRHNK